MEEKEIIFRLRELNEQIHVMQINLTQLQIDLGHFRQDFLKSNNYKGGGN